MQPADFDSAASSYDRDFTDTHTGKAQRASVWALLPDVKGLNILEMNAGTGEDAAHFLAQGAAVWLSDVSEKMLEVADRKTLSYTHKHVFQWDLRQPFPLPNAPLFDLAFSNFGGWNCLTEAEIKTLARELHGLLNEDGRLMLVVMPRFCLWETLYFLAKGKWRSAFRRLSKAGTWANVEGQQVLTYYYAPSQIRRFLYPYFEAEQTKAVGIALLPSYLDKWVHNRGWFAALLAWLEAGLALFPVFAYLSDHYVIRLRKRPYPKV